MIKFLLCVGLAALASVSLATCAKTRTVFDAVDEYLLSNEFTLEPESNVQRCKKMLAETPALAADVEQALQDIVALPTMAARCDNDAYKVMARNAARSTFGKRSRIESVVLHYRQAHTRNCERRLRLEIEAAKRAIDRRDMQAVARAEGLANQVGLSLQAQNMRVMSIPLKLAFEHENFGQNDKDGEFARASITMFSRDDPDYDVVIIRGQASAETVRGLFERTLLQPCELYVHQTDMVADRAAIDGDAMWSFSDYDYRAYHKLAAANHICHSLIDNQQSLVQKLFELSQ